MVLAFQQLKRLSLYHLLIKFWLTSTSKYTSLKNLLISSAIFQARKDGLRHLCNLKKAPDIIVRSFFLCVSLYSDPHYTYIIPLFQLSPPFCKLVLQLIFLSVYIV